MSISKERRDGLRVLSERIGHAPVGFNTMSGPEPNLSGDELRTLLDMADERDELIGHLEAMDRRLRYYEETMCHNDLTRMIGDGTPTKAIDIEKVSKVLNERDRYRHLLERCARYLPDGNAEQRAVRDFIAAVLVLEDKTNAGGEQWVNT